MGGNPPSSSSRTGSEGALRGDISPQEVGKKTRAQEKQPHDWRPWFRHWEAAGPLTFKTHQSDRPGGVFRGAKRGRAARRPSQKKKLSLLVNARRSSRWIRDRPNSGEVGGSAGSGLEDRWLRHTGYPETLLPTPTLTAAYCVVTID